MPSGTPSLRISFDERTIVLYPGLGLVSEGPPGTSEGTAGFLGITSAFPTQEDPGGARWALSAPALPTPLAGGVGVARRRGPWWASRGAHGNPAPLSFCGAHEGAPTCKELESRWS